METATPRRERVFWEYVSEKHRSEPDSGWLLYSDGITGCRDEAGELLGEEELVSFVEDARELAPLSFVHDLLRQVVGRSEGSLRDATAVIVALR